MNGLATRNKLHAANVDAHASDDTYGFSTGRASDKVLGYGEQDDFALPRRPFMPSFTATSIGTPGEARRSLAIRTASRTYGTYSTVFWIGVAASAAVFALWLLHALTSTQVRPADTQIPYIKKAARLVAGTSVHQLDAQGCLVILHKEIVGPLVISQVSEHC